MYRIIINLDSKGICHDSAEPPHLDDILYWASFMDSRGATAELEQWHTPPSLEIGIKEKPIMGVNVYCASALVPDGYVHETVQYWRKKPVDRKFHLFKGSLNSVQGPYRAYNTPIQIYLTRRIVGYFDGDAKKVAQIMQKIKAIGKKTAYGYGKITSFEISPTNDIFCWTRDNIAMRWLPSEEGFRLCRVKPPYWHRDERCAVCEVGDEYILPADPSPQKPVQQSFF
jgi:hypothetical protein